MFLSPKLSKFDPKVNLMNLRPKSLNNQIVYRSRTVTIIWLFLTLPPTEHVTWTCLYSLHF